MKKIYLLVIFIFSTIYLSAQITDVENKLKDVKTDTVAVWKFGGVTNLSFSQTSLTNWASGGVDAFSLNGLVSLFANYADEKNSWTNTLDLGLGYLKQGDDSIHRKTDDKIDFNSIYGLKAFDKFYYSAMLNFKTQFLPGYNYPDINNKISDFLAPAYLTAAIGLNFKPNHYFNAFLAPLTSRTTIVNDDYLSSIGAFGVAEGKKTKNEFGGYIRMMFTKNDFKNAFMKNVSITTKLDLFSNYLDNPQNIDVDWQTLIALKVNKYITVNLNTHLIYDHDIKMIAEDGTQEKAKVQFKEVLGVGFSYNF
jgi:hypothetical protein